MVDMVASVYPDHGENILGVSSVYIFELDFVSKSVEELEDEFEIGIYDEFIVFAVDWDDVQPTDIRIQRQLDGNFEDLDTGRFSQIREYNICWKPPYIEYEGYSRASDSLWIVKSTPILETADNLTVVLNMKFELIEFLNMVGFDDEFQIFTDSPYCNPGSEIGQIEFQKNMKVLLIWFKETE